MKRSIRMSFCLQAATTLNDEDLSALTEGIEAYISAGATTRKAEELAITDVLAQLQADRSEMERLIRAQHPELFVRSASSPASSLSEAQVAATKPRTPSGGRNLRKSLQANDPFRAFLGEFGLNLELRNDFAPSVTEQRKAMAMGYGPIFRRGGLSLDVAAQYAQERGFLAPEGEASATEMYDLVKSMMRGEKIAPQFTDDFDTRMRAEADRRFDDSQGSAEPVNDYPGWSDEDVAEAEAERAAIMASSDLTPAAVADYPDDAPWSFASTASTEEAMRSLGFNEQEIIDGLAQEAANKRAKSRDAGGGDDGPEAAQPASETRSSEARDRAKDGQETGLTSPTAEGLASADQRARKAEAADRAEQKRLTDRARADADRNEFFLTGSDRPADVAAAAGQGDIFGAAADAATTEDAAQPDVAPRAAATQSSKAGAPISDFGQKLEGARKAERLTDAGEELTRNRRSKLKGLAWADVSAMNDTLKVAQVIKSNVWPRPDYAKMVEDGAPAWKAAALKAVYDKLAAAPATRATPTDADLQAYIETMQQIRETLTTELDRVAALQDGPELWKTLSSSNVFGKVFLTPTDASPRYGMAVGTFAIYSEQGKANSKRALLIGGKGAVEALQFHNRMLRKVKDLLSDGFPAKQEAWQKSYEVRQTETRDNDVPEADRTGQLQQRFYVYEKGSRWRLAKGGQDGGYSTQEQAEAFARSLTAKPKREVQPPSRGLDLADATRTGPDWRGGNDVSADEVMSRFGFRGVNLGEYVKAKQGVAQLHLNHVFDAFSDLADLLGVPPKAMSLNGTLGIAVGAQGSGKALAHFVPGVNEINITRDAGAGALAHEFGHAMDHYFATQHGRAASMAKRPYLSAVVENISDTGGVRPEVMDAMRAVMKTLNSRPMTEAEARKYLVDQRELNQRRMDRWVKEFSGNKSADPAALAAVAEKLKRGDLGDAVDGDVEANLSEFMRAAGLRPGNSIAANAFTLAYRLRDLSDEARFVASHIPQVDTDYAKASAAMDAKKQGDGYWSTPWEKFARAFETFAMDALKDRQRESMYLSGLVDSEGWRLWSEETGKAIPYPAGAERMEMQQAFQKLVDTIQTREDDAGNVAIFSRSVDTKAAYESRINALFSGEKAKAGTRVLDRSDVMALLGHADVPLMLNERHLLDGLANHPQMTAEAWKQVPEWLENPAAVYNDPNHPGRLTVIAPVRLAGYPVIMAVEPQAGNPVRGKAGAVPDEHLLVTVFAKTTGGLPRLEYLAGNGRLLYADKKMAPVVWQRAGEIPRAGGKSSGAERILTESNLAGYRRNASPGTDVGLSRTGVPGRTGVPMADAKAVIAAIREALPTAPPIQIHDSVKKAPENLRQQIRQAGADNDVEAAYYEGEIHVFPGNIAGIERMQFVVAHHEIRHHGLRSMLGPAMGPAMLRMYASNPGIKAAANVKIAQGLASTRVLATEEALADMPAEELQKLTGWQRIVSAARQWLRQVAARLRRGGLTSLADAIEPTEWTDSDIASLVQRAEQISRGRSAPFRTGGTVFSRSGDSSAMPFYSELSRAVERSPMNAGLPAAWKQYLDALAKRGAVKADEVEWTGLGEWLALQPGKVSKAQVVEYLDANGVRVTETVLGSQAKVIDARDVAMRRSDYLGYDTMAEALTALRQDFNRSADADQVLYQYDLDPEDRDALKAWLEANDLEQDRTKYKTYQLPGGTNYREVLLTLPERGAARVDDDGQVSFNPDASAAANYKSNHWDQLNILAHIRLNDRTDADGKRVLFVEEMQSDWAQQGKKQGFADPKKAAELRAKADAIRASRPSVATEEGRAAFATRRRLRIEAGELEADSALPTAPFVGKTDAWVALALKRVIKMAVDEGYDRVAFVTGEQSAERYDLSKQVKSIRVVGRTDARTQEKTRSVTVEFNEDGRTATFGVDANGVIDNTSGTAAMTNAKGKPLADVIGKEMAERVVKADLGTLRGGVEFMGGGLKVGGDGMRAFYDKIVPSVLKDVLRKVGGDGLTTADLGNFRESAFTGEPTNDFDVELESQPAFDITDAMREKAAGGLPLFSRSPAEVLHGIDQQSIRNAFLDATTSHGSVGLWGRTIGTQYDKAQRHPQTFGRVFNAVQDYIQDISSFANAAADQAPSILPKLDNFRDLVRKDTPRADLSAVGAVIFQGTLDKQLLDRPALLAKGLTEKQADLYGEFRAAVNQSLEDVAKTEIVRLAGIAGAPLADRALAQPTAREAADILADHLRQQGLTDDADGLYGKVDVVEKLKAEGYAPLMRFGRHTVHIQQDGETLFFGMYESRTEANAMARQLRGDPEFASIPVEQGVMSQESYKLFNGLSIDSLELFANEVGGQDNPVYQDFLKLTKNNRSALKRLIHRKGTAGFSTNTERVLASFVTSNARLASGNLHLGRAKQAANDIPRELGDLKDEAVRLVDYVQNPQEEAQAVRGLLFTTFIGGSVASAMVNMTQPFTMTLPYLSQYGGLAKAGARMLAALKIVASGKATGEIGQALKRAEADGIVSPQEIHHLQAATTESLGNNPYLKKAAFIWGSMFSLAEQFNRRLSFVAAFQTAIDNGMTDPFAFAEKAVIETQGLYCVDEETECLTAGGWKRHDDLMPGESLFAIDEATGALVESRLVDVHRFTGKLKATEFRNSNGFSMVVTDKHDMLIRSHDSRTNTYGKIRRVNPGDLKVGHHFLRVPLSDATGRAPTYSDDEVQLFAWVAAEGSMYNHRNCTGKRGIQIVQSSSHNPEYVAEIDALLDRLGGHYCRMERGTAGGSAAMVRWKLRKVLASKVLAALPGKLVTFGLIEHLTVPQMALFLNTFTKGDGHFPEDGGATITQKFVSNLDALQAMAVLTGQTSTKYDRMGRHDFGLLYVAKNSKHAHARPMTRTEVEVPLVWCPETEHGTWIARRNGRTFVTGNSKANKPNWARGSVGATAMTFKQFSIHYIEWITRMYQSGPEGKRAAITALAILMLAGGAGGLPFADDLDDLIDTLAQALGYDFSAKQAKRKFIAETLGMGETAGEVATRGLTALPGFPMDLSLRLGMGNLLPATGILLRSNTDRSRDVLEVAGAAGSLAKMILDGGEKLLQGDPLGAAKSVVPLAIQNVAKASQMWETGEYRNQKGAKVTNVDGLDAGMKFLGFQPAEVARESANVNSIQRTIQLVKNVEGDLSGRMAQARVDGDSDAEQAARQDLLDWNQNNPQSPIRIRPADIARRARELRASRADRLIKSAPKELRPAVREALN